MDALLTSFVEFVAALKDLIFSLGVVLLPWLGLAAWIIFWLFAVNWVKLRQVLVHGGGWIGLVLIGFVMVVVWGMVGMPAGGTYDVLGLNVSNFVAKTVYVTGLFCVMLLCGAAQLAGAVPAWCLAEEPVAEEEDHGHGHGHDAHGHH